MRIRSHRRLTGPRNRCNSRLLATSFPSMMVVVQWRHAESCMRAWLCVVYLPVARFTEQPVEKLNMPPSSSGLGLRPLTAPTPVQIRLGCGVIGNTADSGSAILGSSPGTPASNPRGFARVFCFSGPCSRDASVKAALNRQFWGKDWAIDPIRGSKRQKSREGSVQTRDFCRFGPCRTGRHRALPRLGTVQSRKREGGRPRLTS